MTTDEVRSESAIVAPWTPISPIKGLGRFLGRVGRALLLESDLYKEVAADRRSLAQAFAVVALVAAATALNTSDDGLVSGAAGLPVNIVLGFVGWIVWASVTFMLGQTFFADRGKPDPLE